MLTDAEIIDRLMKMIPDAGLLEMGAFKLGYQCAVADKAEEDTQRMQEKIDSLVLSSEGTRKETKI